MLELSDLRSRLFMLHCGVIGILVLLHLVQEATPLLGLGTLPLSSLFDLVDESSVPNFFSALALFCASMIAILVAHEQYGASRLLHLGWYFIAGLLMFLAFDEGAAIHDRLSFSVQEKLDLSGIFYIGWILPYVVLLAICSIPLLSVAIALPHKTRLRLIIAASVYVASAMGCEALEALLFESASGGGTLGSVDLNAVNARPLMIFLVTIEEAGEMLGVAMAVRAMLMYLGDDLGVAYFSITRRANR